MLKLLLQNKTVDVNSVDPFTGVNSFWLAALFGHGKMLEVLAEKGADIYICNREKINALHIAVYNNNFQIASLLVRSNYDLTHETENGFTVLMLAAALNRNEITQMIMDHLANGFTKKYQLTILNKNNPKNNLSALSIAILMKNKELAIMLIQGGAQSYYEENSIQKDLSPIFLAAEFEMSDLLEIMCDHGADLNVVNSRGQTPLVFGSQL